MSNTPAAETRSETVTAKSYIATLLQRVVSERLLVDISLPEHGENTLTSTLLQVLPNEGVFLLDEIFPQPQTQALQPGSKIELLALFEGVTLYFDTVIESLQEQDGLRQLRVAFPESVAYKHVREEHRIDVLALEIPVSITVGEGAVLKGQLDDICANGLAVRLAKVTGLKRGQIYPCSIKHEGGGRIEVEIEPTHVSKVDGPLSVKLGSSLRNLDRQALLQWRRFVAEQERRLLRHH